MASRDEARHCSARSAVCMHTVLAVCLSLCLVGSSAALGLGQAEERQMGLDHHFQRHRRLQTVTGWQKAIENTLESADPGSWELVWEEFGGGGLGAEEARVQKEARPPNKDLKQLLKCINSNFEAGEMTWKLAMSGALGYLKAVGAFSYLPPAKLGHRKPFPLTVVTSASVSRLQQLYSQCLSWAGPLSAVLYHPVLQQPGPLTEANQAALRSAAFQVSQFMAAMRQAEGACKPDILLVYEVFQDEAARRLLYPFNILRNMARLQARTPLIAMVDVDLLVSKSLYTRFSQPALAQDVINKARRRRQVFIIPAFDVRGTHEKAAWADALVTTNKDMFVHAHKQNIVFQFAKDAYTVGHALTNYTHWLTAKEDYPAQFEYLCEPWFLGDRLALPWHDARYRGYGMDKVQFVSHVNTSGFGFQVLHDAFAVHRAHKKNEARAVFLNKKTRGNQPTLWKHNIDLYRDQCTAYKSGANFVPVLHPSTENCKSVLNWWRGAPKQ